VWAGAGADSRLLAAKRGCDRKGACPSCEGTRSRRITRGITHTLLAHNIHIIKGVTALLRATWWWAPTACLLR
jgi:hypothetical protein